MTQHIDIDNVTNRKSYDECIELCKACKVNKRKMRLFDARHGSNLQFNWLCCQLYSVLNCIMHKTSTCYCIQCNFMQLELWILYLISCSATVIYLFIYLFIYLHSNQNDITQYYSYFTLFYKLQLFCTRRLALMVNVN